MEEVAPPIAPSPTIAAGQAPGSPEWLPHLETAPSRSVIGIPIKSAAARKRARIAGENWIWYSINCAHKVSSAIPGSPWSSSSLTFFTVSSGKAQPSSSSTAAMMASTFINLLISASLFRIYSNDAFTTRLYNDANLPRPARLPQPSVQAHLLRCIQPHLTDELCPCLAKFSEARCIPPPDVSWFRQSILEGNKYLSDLISFEPLVGAHFNLASAGGEYCAVWLGCVRTTMMRSETRRPCTDTNALPPRISGRYSAPLLEAAQPTRHLVALQSRRRSVCIRRVT